MKICGGRAGCNYVSFSGEKYQSISRFKDGKVATELKMKKRDMKITILLSKIPFVRSFSMIFDLLMGYWRRFLVAIIVLLLMEFFLIGSNSTFLYTIPINSLEMLLGFLVIAGLIIKVSEIGSYHGAEHMTAVAFEKNLNLTLENVRKQPRTHRECGTNLVISYFICYFILFMLFDDAIWLHLVAWSIGFELWKGEPKVIWDLIMVIGKVTQYLFFTSKPQDKHLMVAIEAMKRLVEKESAKEI